MGFLPRIEAGKKRSMPRGPGKKKEGCSPRKRKTKREERGNPQGKGHPLGVEAQRRNRSEQKKRKKVQAKHRPDRTQSFHRDGSGENLINRSFRPAGRGKRSIVAVDGGEKKRLQPLLDHGCGKEVTAEGKRWPSRQVLR